MSELHPNRMLFDAYDANWHKIFYDTKTNGYVAVHVEHGKQELAQNLAVALRLARLGERIELLENSTDNTSADATRDGEIWEFKTTNASQSSIQGRIRKGKRQSGNILLIMPEHFDEAEVLSGLLNAVNMDASDLIKKIDLLFNDNKIAAFDKLMIQKRQFEAFWNSLK